ncbi:ABC transporter substrate-binding protein [Paenibacillus beijingensis]|uniref:ABC transporter substrate-binding protein n=1 Tax=Paenibacillus beijingensis TaxID=1126833 RepID=A0A0D5NJU5_9BACL|nr:ABC transporter substrate-binding protein [Paenibacillus beijingensis]AJY75400.1 ABC transporter substrate-binding protein [Paenibacillus beijingensis]
MRSVKNRFVFAVLIAIVILSGCGSQKNETTASGNAAGGNEKTAAASGNTASGGEKTAPEAGLSGELSFYTSQPEDDAAKLTEAFTAKYPDVKVNVFRSGTEEVTAKIQAEKQAGEVQADVLLLADAVTFEGLKKEDLLLSYKSPELSGIPQSLVDPDGTYAGTKVIATILASNTKKVAAAPSSWKVLAAADSKGAAIMPSPLYSGAAAYNIGVFSRTDGLGWEFLQGLKDNGMTVIKGNGAVMKAVASGEKSYGVVVDFMVAREKAKGSPVELAYPEEGVPIITEPIAIVKNSKHEELAKAFVDFVLSEEGQKVASEIGYTPIREGVAPPQGLKGIADMKILSGDMAVLTNERDADKQKFTELFGK